MRRREKFVIASILLSLGLLGVQYVTLEYRYWAVAVLTLVSYLISAWALADDLQRHEWVTIVPFPAFYTGAVALFYFLLPEHLLSKLFILVLFCIGMYALYLTSNIYSVAKGRTIQLLHAAHAIGLLFTLLTSLLFTNTVFSLRLPWFVNGLAIGLVHFPLVLMSLWSIELEPRISEKVTGLALLSSVALAELGLILSFYPFSVWNQALFVMTFLYIALGLFHNFLRGRLFNKTMTEYSLVAVFLGLVFVVLFPLK
ncbi:MAG TPA: hypothetical protein VD999_00770 [Vitreimonas sp.]|nr:hypothetical protein [Vitreimonas sp.]